MPRWTGLGRIQDENQKSTFSILGLGWSEFPRHSLFGTGILTYIDP